MKSSNFIRGVWVSLLFFGFQVGVQASPMTLDLEHTRVTFKVAHLVVSTVSGNFTSFGGGGDFDQKKPENLKIDAYVDVGSITTNNPKRDKHLKSEDFFDAQKFSKMILRTIKNKHGIKIGENKYSIPMELTIRDAKKEIPVIFEYEGKIVTDGKERHAFQLHAKIKRQDFGIVFNNLADDVPLVGDKVDIDVVGEAYR